MKIVNSVCECDLFCVDKIKACKINEEKLQTNDIEVRETKRGREKNIAHVIIKKVKNKTMVQTMKFP